jgi:hypothetical protein
MPYALNAGVGLVFQLTLLKLVVLLQPVVESVGDIDVLEYQVVV